MSIPSTEPNRALITICVMLATIMQALDTTIANVALPYMQGSLSATQDQVNWVLTSYIVAAAVMTAPVGWLAERFSRKRVFILSAAGFTLASLLCAIAQSMADMVLYRVLQGVFGAALVPISQAIMMDIYPPERRGSAMAIWGMGVMIGPIMGPTLGGWLTEYYSWRWVFLINLPFGIATVLGLMAFLPDKAPRREMTFDWFGFIALTTAIGAFQLMLDRGESLAWFESREIVAEAIVAGVAFYFFLAHTLTTDRPFIAPALFADRNFTLGVVFMFIVGVLILATLALVTPYIQQLMGYPVLQAGMLLGTRGVGTMLSMMLVGRLLRSIDARILIALGLGLSTFTLWELVGLAPESSAFTVVWTGFIQGIGLGLLFVPLNTIAFATLAPRLRAEGAAMWTLIRNLGSSIGVSLVIAELIGTTSLMHAHLAEQVTPFNLGLQGGLTASMNVSTPEGLAQLDAQVTGQAMQIAYANDFLLMAIVSALALPLVLAFAKPASSRMGAPHAAMD